MEPEGAKCLSETTFRSPRVESERTELMSIRNNLSVVSKDGAKKGRVSIRNNLSVVFKDGVRKGRVFIRKNLFVVSKDGARKDWVSVRNNFFVFRVGAIRTPFDEKLL